MTRPALLRAIYQELRSSLGPTATAGDVVRLAHLLLRSYVDELPPDTDPGYETARGSKPFASLPVDLAMRDGGWRVLEYESDLMMSLRDRDISALARFRPLIEKYLGPEWQHQALTGQLSP
jgi:hypothetical protein